MLGHRIMTIKGGMEYDEKTNSYVSGRFILLSAYPNWGSERCLSNRKKK
jgi:hypothetical protein